ncbi:MAG: hypothetical protein Q4E01_04455 [Actinomycetaceae bacterium]|nr:hypothetical protein [Actinomycetaceae bacterium]
METLVVVLGLGAAVVAVFAVVARKKAHQRATEPADSFISEESSPASAGAATEQEAAAESLVEDDDDDEDDEEAADSDGEELAEVDESQVLVEASTPLDAFDLDAAIRDMRREYWASRWMLGEDACADLRFGLGHARGLASTSLTNTTLDEDGNPSFPAGFTRMNAAISTLEELAYPLRMLRAKRYAHAVDAMRMEAPADINPHRAAIKAGRYVSPDPTFGLARLAAELDAGLGNARLEVAKVSPTAGSTVSARLRAGLADANSQLTSALADLDRLEEPTTERLLRIESKLLRGVWWRRAIDLTGKYLQAREWAQTSQDSAEWTRLAVLSTRLTQVLIDLHESVDKKDIIKLAGCLVLLDPGPNKMREDLPVTVAREITSTCEQIALNVSEK